MKIWNVIRTYGTLALLVVSCHVHANIIVEKLSRATASDVIFDSLNSRQWLGWDVTKGLTYARTLALTQVGEQFAGYSIAHNSDAQAFVNAMSPSNACGLYGYSKCIDTENQYRQQLVGETYTQYSPINRFDVDIVLFLGNTEEGERVGFIRVNTYDIGTDPVYKNTNLNVA